MHIGPQPTGVIMEWVTTSTILDDLRDHENRSVWDRFVARFRAPIVSFAQSMCLPHADAEDVAQEALLAFAESYRNGNYDPSKGRLSHWLFGIAFRQVQRIRARRARQEVQVPPAADGTPAEGDTSFWSGLPDENVATASWNHTWERAVLEQCLEQVRQEVEPTTFRAFEKLALGGRPPAEVASELGITRNAAFIAKHRVLRRLRELQQEYEQLP